MSRVDISSGGFSKSSLPKGMLQTDNALTTTLQVVKDNLGNSSTLLLSTVDAQVNSTLRIHTDNTELLDIEDSLANNRFNINRSTQQINLDFASNPTLATTQVGAIRTYQDGVNLSNAASFFKNGNVSFGATNNFYWDNVNSRLGIGTTTPISSLTINEATANPNITLQRNGTSKGSFFETSGGTQLQGSGNGLYLGANSRQDIVLNWDGNNYSQSATFTFGASSSLGAKLAIKGSGSTSATTSFLVQDSAGNTSFRIKDDGSLSNGGNGNMVLSFSQYWVISGNASSIGNYISQQGMSYYSTQPFCLNVSSGNQKASASLQIDSTTQGFLPPRMTDAQVRAIAYPAVGLMAYNTDLDCPVFYSAAGWRKISHSAM